LPIFVPEAAMTAERSRQPEGIQVPISAGELLDKITILQIKSERISDAAKLENVHHELSVLSAVRNRAIPASTEVEALTAELQRVNEALWDVEDEIRLCERRKDFGPRFVELARSVYRHNDHRSLLKRRLNDLLGSALKEEKSYASPDEPLGGETG
jgi:hypothetical protein